MRYLKVFESDKNWEKMYDDTEVKLQEIIDLNNIDIDIDYIKDISASATDVFSGNQIVYEKYIDIGEEKDDNFESWQLIGKERGENYNESGYSMLLDFYRLLFSTRKICYLTFVVNILFKNNISLSTGYKFHPKDPNIILFKEEEKDIESRCKGENILFNDNNISLLSEGEKINFISLTFRKRLNISKGGFDNRKMLSPNIITDFDAFVSTHNISREAEDDLIKLINKAQEG